MPNASAPSAPWVDVWLSPQTIVIPGCERPSSGPITCTIPSRPLPVAKSLTPNSSQLRRSASSCAAASSSAWPVVGRDVVIHRRERQVGPPHLSPGQTQALEGLRRGHLVDEVEVDVEQRRLALGLGDEVRFPDAIEERLSHLRIVAIRRGGRAQGAFGRCGTVAPMAERALSVRDLNRALLARQLLLERSKLPLAKALDRIGGIQAQYSPSSYIGLWSRLEKFELGDLTRSLEQRRVVQGTLLRSTATSFRPATTGPSRSEARPHVRKHGSASTRSAFRGRTWSRPPGPYGGRLPSGSSTATSFHEPDAEMY